MLELKTDALVTLSILPPYDKEELMKLQLEDPGIGIFELEEKGSKPWKQRYPDTQIRPH